MNGNSNFIRPCTLVWLALVLLTLITFSIGEAGLSGPNVVLFLLAVALVKSHMVASFFMGLRRTRLLWRAIMGAYLLLVVGLIAVAYWMGLAA
jgi:hypothetical protein